MSDKKIYVGKKGTKTSYPARHQSKAPRRSLNRFKAESDSKRVGASAKKLKVCKIATKVLMPVWNFAPKSYSSGKKVLDIAVNIAVCNFNDGLTSILRIMKVLQMDIVQSYNFYLETDTKRIEHAELSLIDAAKEARSSIKSSRKENEEKYLNVEGELYGPGIVD